MNILKHPLLVSILFLIACQNNDKPAPTISSFTPISGPEGTTVTISGSNFNSTAADNIVMFNGLTAAVTSTLPGQLVATVPVGATTGKISISVSGSLLTSQNDFVVLPAITIVDPIKGEEGTPVTITGTSFSAKLADNIVKFNGTAAIVTAATPTQLTTTVPVGSSSGKISVTISGTTVSSSNDFTVPHCLLASVTGVSTGFPDDERNGTETNVLTYDANNNLIKNEGDVDNIQYTYTNGLVTKVINTGDESDETWTYNDKKLVKHIDGKFTGSTDTYSEDFTYDDAGKVISVKVFNDGDLSYNAVATYSGGNVISVVGSDEGETDPVFESTYTSFDNKKNPFLLLAKATGNQAAFINYGLSGTDISKNNELTGDDSTLGHHTVVYEYNANGYPTKITFTYASGGKTILTLTYTNCD